MMDIFVLKIEIELESKFKNTIKYSKSNICGSINPIRLKIIKLDGQIFFDVYFCNKIIVNNNSDRSYCC